MQMSLHKRALTMAVCIIAFVLLDMQESHGDGSPPLFVQVNPKGTYLFTAANDRAVAATSVDLTRLGVSPGDFLRLMRVGAFQPGAASSDNSTSLGAVFSDGRAFLAPGPQSETSPVVTPPTFFTPTPTDIPQDFNVPGTPVLVQVPAGATSLLLSPVDSFFSDNTDPNGDYGVQIASVLLPSPPSVSAWRIRGIGAPSWGGQETWTAPANANKLPFIRSLGANYVMLDTFHRVQLSTGQLSTSPAFGEFPEGLRQAQQIGLRSAVYAHLLTEDGTTLWRPWQPPNPDQFFRDYKQLVLDHARVAQAGGADILVIGAEMNSVYGPLYRPYWLDIIASVRSIFTGKITTGYLADPHVRITQDSLNQVLSFWDQLDFIGLSVYPVLSNSTSPTVDELINDWYHSIRTGQNLLENLKHFSTLTGKQVLFTEIGYPSVDGAVRSPGRVDETSGAVNFQLQANLYTAMLTVMGREVGPWFAGMFIWQGVTAVVRGNVTYYTTDQPVSWRKTYDFDPNPVTGETKPAADVVRQWFGALSTADAVIPGNADFDGDGRADLLWRHTGTGQVVVWLLNGFSVQRYDSPATVNEPGWQIVGVGDVNGDGKADLLWRHTPTGVIVVWLMDGTRLVTYGALGQVPDLAWQIVGMGDFDGDGKADLLWRHTGTGQVVVWLLNGFSVERYDSPATVNEPGWQIVGVGDVDGDGQADLVWHHTPTGTVVVWLMDGTHLVTYGALGQVPDLDWQIQR